MTERDFLAKVFSNAFKNFSDKRIVLYGLSVATKNILELFPQYNFIGLLDGYRNEGEQYGFPVLSLSDVANLKPDCIIIIARTNSRKIIAKRIKSFCFNQQISLYDIHGANLLAEPELIVAGSSHCFISAADIEHEIQRHQVISFDIFDTLLMRKVLLPEDIFILVEKKTGIVGFKDARIKAERELNKYGAPNIKDIYILLQKSLKLKKSFCEYVMNVEFETELENLIVRERILQLLEYALSIGKKVFLISDMYWSVMQMQAILSSKGISGYQKLFVSSAYQTNKMGNLFDIFKNEIVAETYLHIGDNKEADILSAKFHGIDSIQIYSALDLMEMSAGRTILDHNISFEERTMMGFLIARVLNDPFALHQANGKLNILGGYDLGYCLVAPMLTAFLFWLIQDKGFVNKQILFGARDGYILEKMYALLKKKFPGKKWAEHTYFYISRMAAICASLKNKNDILYAAKIGFEGNPEELLQKRFFLKETEILLQEKNESTEEYILRHEKIILQRAQALRQCYLKYIKSLNIKQNNEVVFFDFVSSGTCQMCLEELLGKKVNGKYFIHFFEDYVKKQNLEVDAFFEKGFLYNLKSYLSANYLLVESVIVSLEPTLKNFSKDGLPIFLEEKRTEAELTYIKDVQQGILDYFEEYIKIIDFKNIFEIRSLFVDQIYSLVSRQYTNVEKCVLAQEITRDEFCNRKYIMNNILE